MWGNNSYGQLGNGESGEDLFVSTPQLIELPGGTITQLSLGGLHTGAIVTDGLTNHLYMWGRNTEGQLGNGTIEDVSSPELIDLPTGEIKQLVLGGMHSGVVITEDGNDKLYTWGDNDYGQLGNGGVAEEWKGK